MLYDPFCDCAMLHAPTISGLRVQSPEVFANYKAAKIRNMNVSQDLPLAGWVIVLWAMACGPRGRATTH